MAEKSKDKSSKIEKKSKKDKKDKSDKKEKAKSEKQEKAAKAAFSLLADDKKVDPTLSSLFAAKPTPLQRPELPEEPESQDEPDAELSEIDEEIEDEESEDGAAAAEVNGAVGPARAELVASLSADEAPSKRKRKREDADDDLEGAYLRKLKKEEAKEAKSAAAERAAKRQKSAIIEGEESVKDAESEDAESDDGDVQVEIEPESGDEADEVDSDAASPPPKHETQEAASNELTKASRTVFLGNVSTTAITSKAARKTLIAHLTSFFPKSKDVSHKTKDTSSKTKLESIRFRSTPYSSAVPKKAAYAKKELMDATTKSTNAYAVYSLPALAREAARALNATVVLERHLRVDEVAHPAKIDHKRCVFIGNLGFVDDETNIQAANAEEGREHRKAAKQPADAEEGLWRTMGRHGKVESVRVIRDSATRVGKGIAYVQFVDENSVEAALLDDEKKFPPMLPRKLRVQRAKAQKRNAKPGSGRPGTVNPADARGKTAASGYKRKISAEEASQMGRTGKLFGKAAAAQTMRSARFAPEAGSANANREPVGARGSRASGAGTGILKPEAFVFEGHRATRKQGTTGLKLGGKGVGGKKKGGKPTTRSAKRGAAYKASGKKAA